MMPAAAGLPQPETLGVVGESSLQNMRVIAERSQADCRALGLMAATATCERLKRTLSNPQPERMTVSTLYVELKSRLYDELTPR
jgi:predicted ATP-dependent serine protease